jgi:hypothetical protein
MRQAHRKLAEGEQMQPGNQGESRRGVRLLGFWPEREDSLEEGWGPLTNLRPEP